MTTQTTRPTALVVILRRHVGHSLRCVRQSCTVAGWVMETVAIRCEDCGEIVIEGTERLRRAPGGSGGES